MKTTYSSPSSYLNLFFKGKDKFKFLPENDEYQNQDWQLSWIEDENFVLAKRIIDRDVGADYFEDVIKGTLIECVAFMRGVR